MERRNFIAMAGTGILGTSQVAKFSFWNFFVNIQIKVGEKCGK